MNAEIAVKVGQETTTANRICVWVLGMHRSGTSALTRTLNLLGCDLPQSLLPASPGDNDMGFWESRRLIEFDEEILKSAGSRWDDWTEFNPGWFSSPKYPDFQRKAIDLLEKEFGSSPIFVLKEPRICRFAPFWLETFKAANVTPRILLPIRNPLEVAASLAKRNNIEPELAHLLWLRHTLDAERFTRGQLRFFLSYDQLMNGWPRLMKDTERALKLEWSRFSDDVSHEISSFLSPDYRHHCKAVEDVTDNPLLSGWLRDAYAILHRWTQSSERPSDLPVLDRIRTELDLAAPAFARLVASGRKATQVVDSLKTELNRTVSGFEEQLEAARNETTERDQALSRLNAEHVAHAAHMVEAQKEIGHWRTVAQTAAGELDRMKGQVAHLESALAQRRAEADEVTALLMDERTKWATLQQSLMDECARSAALQEELAAQQAKFAAAKQAYQSELASTRSEAEQAHEHLHDLEERLAEAFRDLSRLAQSRLAADQELRVLRSASDQASKSEALLAETRVERDALAQSLHVKDMEIARQTDEIAQQTAEIARRTADSTWLQEATSVLFSGKSPLLVLLPQSIRYRMWKKALRRRGLFDDDAYLSANSDVARSRMDPLRHYMRHGIQEGRSRGL